MAKIEIIMEMRIDNAMKALQSACEDWPQEKKDRFALEWKALESEGAEMVEVKLIGGRAVAYPHEDFTKHMEAYGVHLW